MYLLYLYYKNVFIIFDHTYSSQHGREERTWALMLDTPEFEFQLCHLLSL